MTIKIQAPKRGRLAHNQKSKRVAFRCPQSIVDTLQQIATDNQVSISAVIVAALKDYTKCHPVTMELFCKNSTKQQIKDYLITNGFIEKYESFNSMCDTQYHTYTHKNNKLTMMWNSSTCKTDIDYYIAAEHQFRLKK